MYQISCHFDQSIVEHCSKMMFFKFVLIFVIVSIQKSNYSFAKSAEIPGDCKDIECLMNLLRQQKESPPTEKPSRKIKLYSKLVTSYRGHTLTK